MVRVLGLDLGAHTHGCAWLDVTQSGGATYREHDSAKTADEVRRGVIAGKPDLVVLEEPYGVHGGMSHGAAISVGNAVAAALKHGGAIREACGAAGIPVVTLSAREARKALGCPNTDAGVKRAVMLRVKGWPKVSSNHARDAAAAAIVGAMRHARASTVALAAVSAPGRVDGRTGSEEGRKTATRGSATGVRNDPGREKGAGR